MQAAATQAWTRETAWRQGRVLRLDDARALRLLHETDPEATCVMAVSHDCDIVQDNLTAEPNVEFIVGRIVDKQNGTYAWAKAPRTLHLEMARGGHPAIVELLATGKATLPKTDLAQFSPDDSFTLTGPNLGVLRAWLAVRYCRAAFADAFTNRMTRRPTNLDDHLAKIFQKYGKTVTAAYFNVDDGNHLDRSNGSAYELSIVLAYDPSKDAEAAADEAESAVGEVLKLFEDKLYNKDNETWQHIHLLNCVAISEDDLTVAKARVLMAWRFEHLSLRADEPQAAPFSPAG
jgi:hypothetical protein